MPKPATTLSLLALAALIAVPALAPPATSVTPAAPAFTVHPATGGLGTDGGEPSVAVSWATGAAFVQAGTQTLRATFAGSAPVASWSDQSPLLTSFFTEDPILFGDTHTGRIFVSQLAGPCSLMSYTDDDGGLWVPNPLGCGVAGGNDHQTVGGGPFAAPLSGTPLYRDSVYYCAQAGVDASCALSADGGQTFGPAVPIYLASQCVGLHGHIRVAPDGTAYVPNMDCGGEQAAVVSADNGLTWSVRRLPGSTTQDESDPSVAVGSGGRAYFCYQDGDGHPKARASGDQGQHWSAAVDLGAAFGIQNSQFPAVVAGDNDRAACAFLGTPAGGDDQSSSFQGVWELYVAFTYDGGQTWQTSLATGSDPVQRGCIWMQGGGSACRNLLDFMDISVGADGRVYVAFADGCVSAKCVGPNGTPSDSRDSLATIAREASGGLGLFASHDPLP